MWHKYIIVVSVVLFLSATLFGMSSRELSIADVVKDCVCTQQGDEVRWTRDAEGVALPDISFRDQNLYVRARVASLKGLPKLVKKIKDVFALSLKGVYLSADITKLKPKYFVGLNPTILWMQLSDQFRICRPGVFTCMTNLQKLYIEYKKKSFDVVKHFIVEEVISAAPQAQIIFKRVKCFPLTY